MGFGSERVAETRTAVGSVSSVPAPVSKSKCESFRKLAVLIGVVGALVALWLTVANALPGIDSNTKIALLTGAGIGSVAVVGGVSYFLFRGCRAKKAVAPEPTSTTVIVPVAGSSTTARSAPVAYDDRPFDDSL